MVAVALEKSERCYSCGLTEQAYVDDPDAFGAVQTVCPWCALKDRERSDGDTDRSIPGASVKLLPRAAIERAAETRAERPPSRRERAQGIRR